MAVETHGFPVLASCADYDDDGSNPEDTSDELSSAASVILLSINRLNVEFYNCN